MKHKELMSHKLKGNLIAGGAFILILMPILLVRNYYLKIKLIKQLEQQNKDIINENEHLEELILVRNRLFSIISHDLRGPVNSIKEIVDFIIAEEMNEDEKSFYVEKISQSLHATSNLADSILQWAKSQMDGIQVNPTLFDIQDIIQQNVSLIETRAEGKQISIIAERKSETQRVFADSAMIDTVIRNIIENAVKFLNAGNSITVDTQEENGKVITSIKDDGQGISLEDQCKIFNKNITYTNFGTDKEKGGGLGLLLCQELVEKNKGRIWFESNSKHGTTFYFTVPINDEQ